MNGALNTLPVWVKIITTVGFPILVALILLYVIFGNTVPELSQSVSASVETSRETNSLVKEHNDDSTKQTELFRLICRNTAKSEFAAANCDKI